MKEHLSDLALFGGRPAFAEKLHVGRPNLGRREAMLARVNEVFDRRWLSNRGVLVQEFERQVAEFTGVKHCIAMCNATVALEIAIRALDLTGEVIVPSFTFIATAHSLQWQGITPVFCDIDPDTHCLDPDRVAQLVTPRTTGILGVHLWGRPCAVERLQEVADRFGLRLLFDAAHAFGCAHKGRMIGNFGRAEVFSFHATKFVNTGEGGAVVTNDEELAKKMRLMQNFGFAGYDRVIYIGTNGKMQEISAALGLTNLESAGEFLAANRRNYQWYRRETAGLPGVRLLEHDDTERHNYQYVVIEIEASLAGLSRDDLVNVLQTENVLARRYFHPGCHRMEPYRSYFPNAGLMLPQTERLTARVLLLPTGTSIEPEDIGRIGAILRLAVCHAPEIHDRLAETSPAHVV